MISSNGSVEARPAPVPVFRGPKAACREFGLVLDAQGIAYECTVVEGTCTLLVAAAAAGAAAEELARYAAETRPQHSPEADFVPFAGSAWGAAIYACVLMLVAYCAGVQAFGIDWLRAGAIESKAGAAFEWWRSVTALTLHVDQEHFLGNLLFGAGIGLLAGRMFGAGFAWFSMVLSGAAGDYLDMLWSPWGHRAVGASTAVFAGLGLLSGYGWSLRQLTRGRRRYRWGPLCAGICLLTLLGAGNEHVDVLGHLLGFTTGTALGWSVARLGGPKGRGLGFQWAMGILTLTLVCVAWFEAAQSHPGP